MMEKHFLLISFPSQGHINPNLQLAKRLISAGAHVTYATTVLGFKNIKNPLSLDGLSYATFSDGFEDERPIDSTPEEVMLTMKQVGPPTLAELISRLQSDNRKPITCLIYSIILPWAAQVARRFRIPSAIFSIQSATTFAVYHKFFNNQDGLFCESIKNEGVPPILLPGLPPLSSHDLPSFLVPDDPNFFFIDTVQEHIQALENDPTPYVLVNTFDSLEAHQIETFGNINPIPIGPLVPSAFIDGSESSSDRAFGCDLFEDSEDDYLAWLNEKPNSSVVYASFGSMVALSEIQIKEIFHGLVQTQRPFLLVIRSNLIKDNVSNKVRVADDRGSENNNCFDNFNKRQGLIVPWCSQLEVLSHPAVGCFVSHCGWNSTLESMVSGLPVVACPHFSDQLTNAKLLDEVWGNGIRARATEAGLVNGEEITRCVEVVMGDGERGKKIRKNAMKWKRLAMEALKEGGSSCNNLKLFVDGF